MPGLEKRADVVNDFLDRAPVSLSLEGIIDFNDRPSFGFAIRWVLFGFQAIQLSQNFVVTDDEFSLFAIVLADKADDFSPAFPDLGAFRGDLAGERFAAEENPVSRVGRGQ